MNLRLVLASLTACSGLAFATTAAAAPAMPCAPATMTPQTTSFPANLPAFGFTATTATANDVHLFSVSGGARTELPLVVGPTVENGYLKIAPAAPLVAGTAYELQYQSFCSYGAYPATPLTFTAAAEAPLPTTLGTLTSGPTVTLTDYGTTQVALVATYTIAEEMKPWFGVYQIGIELDGTVIETHAIAAGGNAVQVNATGWCTEANAATKKHSVVLRGRLPFAPSVVTTSAALEFDCPAPRIGTPPNNGAVPPTNVGGTSGTSGSSGASGASGTSGSSGAGGCSTSPASSPASAVASLGLLFGLASLVRRRLRRARPVSAESQASRRT